MSVLLVWILVIVFCVLFWALIAWLLSLVF